MPGLNRLLPMLALLGALSVLGLALAWLVNADAPMAGEVPVHGLGTEGRTRGPHDRDQHIRREEDLQGLEVQAPVRPAGQPVDGAEVVVGIGVQFGNGHPVDAVVDIVGPLSRGNACRKRLVFSTPACQDETPHPITGTQPETCDVVIEVIKVRSIARRNPSTVVGSLE
jgi:hypothetical protein